VVAAGEDGGGWAHVRAEGRIADGVDDRADIRADCVEPQATSATAKAAVATGTEPNLGMHRHRTLQACSTTRLSKLSAILVQLAIRPDIAIQPEYDHDRDLSAGHDKGGRSSPCRLDIWQ
jgi:hypothetical protein